MIRVFSSDSKTGESRHGGQEMIAARATAAGIQVRIGIEGEPRNEVSLINSTLAHEVIDYRRKRWVL